MFISLKDHSMTKHIESHPTLPYKTSQLCLWIDQSL